MTQTSLNIAGMDCASCVSHVDRALRQTPGVQSCSVNLARGRATVSFDPAATSPSALAQAVTSAGYPSTPESPDLSPALAEQQRLNRQTQHAQAWLRRAIVGFVLWLPLELTHWLFYATSHHHTHLFPTWMDYLSLLASTLSIFYLGAGFYRGAYAAAKRRTTSMDTLIAMGATVAYLYSLIALLGYLAHLWPTLPQLYFMESTGLLALISLGHYLEARARQSAGSAIQQLLQLTPPTAHRLLEKNGDAASFPPLSSFTIQNSEFETVPLSQIQLHDLLLIRPGDRIPVDGVVTDGLSSIDESMLTGESLPVTRSPGDNVIAGSLNNDGRLIVRATRLGSETALAQIVQLVETAQSDKPPVQQLADRISAIFVPSVIAIALLTGVIWFLIGSSHHWPPSVTWASIANTVCSVLIIACPCALGLALPAAIMVGTGLGAKRGILIRNIDALQSAQRINTVVLDKTGTLTQGKPSLTSLHPVPGISPDDLLRLAASAEQFSEHPLARAIVSHARAQNLPLSTPDSFLSHPGQGVAATIDGAHLLVGNSSFVSSSISQKMEPDDMQMVVHVARNGVPMGSICLKDDLKKSTFQAISDLRRLGLRLIILTGDTPASAQSVADSLSITEVHAQVKPADKLRIIKDLQSQGAIVAMVGDGINDAPALAAADLGIAIGSASDIARETGQIILTSTSLTGVATAIYLSKATMRTVHQNLFFAFLYNVLAIPLAAAGLLTPLIAAAAMALSDITVLGNALRLRRSRIDP